MLKKSKFLFFAVASYSLLIFSCTPKEMNPLTLEPQKNFKKAKNVILMIGDGMGLTQLTAGMYANGNQTILEKFPVVGLHKPHSSSNLVTDSASGATAFSCGIKTYNAAIGVNSDTVAVKTILEEAEEKGYATGMVATSTIVHATPASFIAHVKSRDMYEEIAADFVKTEIDYFVGGGKKYFDRRKDERNIYKELEDAGYYVSDFVKEDFENVETNFKTNFAYFTSDSDPLPVAQGRDYLPLASKVGAIFLKNHSDKGFFLMVEGSQIDWGGHANQTEYIISEVIDFDQAIAEILAFAKEDGETLIIVTADHETGGFAINPGSTMDQIVGKFTSDYHTATMVPVFAYGPGAELFAGIYENTAIYDKMRKALGF